MNALQSLRRGVIATAGAVFASLFLCLQVSPEWLTGWGTVILVAMVPAQIVISLVWQASYPKRLADLSQPLRGIAFTALNVLVGVAVAYLAWQTVGGGTSALIGRFTPAYLGVTSSASLAPACGAFSYQGQLIGFAGGQPQIAVTGFNRQGGVTRNYDRGAFWRLAPPQRQP